MPTHNRFGLDDGDGGQNVRTEPIQPDEQGTVDRAQLHPPRSALLQDIELMPQHQDFSFQPPSRLEAVAQHPEEQQTHCDHSTIMLRFAADRESIGWGFRKRHEA
jgi:hypothetical protein